jgi:hypothetical protein
MRYQLAEALSAPRLIGRNQITNAICDNLRRCWLVGPLLGFARSVDIVTPPLSA